MEIKSKFIKRKKSVKNKKNGLDNLNLKQREIEYKDDLPCYRYTNHFMEFINDSGPYFFFITLTFGKNIGHSKRCQFANVLIHRFNQMVFQRGFKKKGNFMQGFAIFEDHKSSKLEDKLHIHMLIKSHRKYYQKDFSEYIGIFKCALAKVRDDKKRPIFSEECNKIQPYNDVGAIEYSMKQIWDCNIDRIKMIGVDGLSDNFI